MNSSFSTPFPGILGLLLTCAALHAEPADGLIAKGDVHYINLQAAEALKYYLPAEKLSPTTCASSCGSGEYRHLMTEPRSPRNAPLGATAVEYAKRRIVRCRNWTATKLREESQSGASLGRILPLESADLHHSDDGTRLEDAGYPSKADFESAPTGP